MHVVKFLLKMLSFVGVFVLFLIIIIYASGLIICYGPSTHARNLFITTLLETGQIKFAASLFMSSDKIQEIVDSNSMTVFDAEIDDSLIDTSNIEDIDGVELVEITGSTYTAKMLIINDPSRVKLATIYDGSWKTYGVTLDTLVNDNNAIAGVNGGLYYSSGNQGGKPLGVVVRDGVVEYNDPTGISGLHLIGLDSNNLLRIIDLSGMSKSEIAPLIEEEDIRDAVTFQEESSDANNHFVKLIINGESREVNGSGSGANPRTAIGQREDGAILLLVTDGRGANGHLGATAADLIEIMEEYGAVNAANLDGGSSSSMYYNGKYEMTSVTLYYSNSSWRLPTAFIVEDR